jgi:N-formylglutamate amidohydrolase
MDDAFLIERGHGAIVAAALHDGHEVRPEVERLLAIPEAERRREEDPFTAPWTAVGDHRIVARRSRFEVDLNRPAELAIYLTPEQAWGLRVWRAAPSPELLEGSQAIHRAFYCRVGDLFEVLARSHGRFVVLDLHSYNHRRDGPAAPPGEPGANPEVNVGTGTLDRERWATVVDRFVADLRAHDFRGRRLEVAENVRFQGGGFAAWAHRAFPASACVLAVEWKKFFMDEWTGRPDPDELAAVGRALAATVPGLRASLAHLGGRR